MGIRAREGGPSSKATLCWVRNPTVGRLCDLQVPDHQVPGTAAIRRQPARPPLLQQLTIDRKARYCALSAPLLLECVSVYPTACLPTKGENCVLVTHLARSARLLRFR